MNKTEIIEILKTVKYPGFSRDIVSFGLIKEVETNSDIINLKLQLTTANPEHKNQLSKDIKNVLSTNKPSFRVNIGLDLSTTGTR